MALAPRKPLQDISNAPEHVSWAAASEFRARLVPVPPAACGSSGPVRRRVQDSASEDELAQAAQWMKSSPAFSAYGRGYNAAVVDNTLTMLGERKTQRMVIFKPGALPANVVGEDGVLWADFWSFGREPSTSTVSPQQYAIVPDLQGIWVQMDCECAFVNHVKSYWESGEKARRRMRRNWLFSMTRSINGSSSAGGSSGARARGPGAAAAAIGSSCAGCAPPPVGCVAIAAFTEAEPLHAVHTACHIFTRSKMSSSFQHSSLDRLYTESAADPSQVAIFFPHASTETGTVCAAVALRPADRNLSIARNFRTTSNVVVAPITTVAPDDAPTQSSKKNNTLSVGGFPSPFGRRLEAIG